MISESQFSLKKNIRFEIFKNSENFKVLEMTSLRYLQSALHLDLSRCQGRESSSTVELMSGRQLMISRGQFQNNLPNLIQGKDQAQIRVKSRSKFESKQNQNFKSGSIFGERPLNKLWLVYFTLLNNEHVIFSLSTRRPISDYIKYMPKDKYPKCEKFSEYEIYTIT